MGRHLKPIGGEFWFETDIFESNRNNFNNNNATFLSGGQSAINFILTCLDIKEYETILVPAFLCPTILYNFHSKKINYEFYKINKDLSIDLYDLSIKISRNRVKALFFINYFGFYNNVDTQNYLTALKDKGIKIIEDSVQMLWFNNKNYIGDYVFNSYRKFLPIDGSIVISNNVSDFQGSEDEYYTFAYKARLVKTGFINFNIGREEEFLELFSKAEEAYYNRKSICGMDSASRYLLNKINYERIRTIRVNNYNYLYDKLINSNKIKILFDKNKINSNTPIGFPILIENRDIIRKKLRESSIYCPVHWDITKEGWTQKYISSLYLAKNILTLPIDHRYNMEDMDKLANSIM